jgi:CHAT domain
MRLQSEGSLLRSYVEFAIEIRRGLKEMLGDRITVDCTRPDTGRLPSTDADPLTSSVARLLHDETAEQRISLGEALGGCLFPPRVLTAFQETLEGIDQDTGVRLRLVCQDEEMSHWPWELARIDLPSLEIPPYLFRDERISLVREVPSTRPVQQPKERRKLIILTADATRVPGEPELMADFPTNLPDLGVLKRHPLSRPTKKSIEEAINQIANGPDPLDIFHFTGHGRPPREGQPGVLVLYREGDTGARDYPSDELAQRLARAGTSLAFINACYSDDKSASGDGLGVAQSLTQVVPVVVAMRGAVADRAAKRFADVFYRWLLRGSTVDEAVSRGRAALDDSMPDWARVVLYSRARGGRFLQPAASVPQAAEPAPAPASLQPVPGAIRRWAVMAGGQGHWQLVPGDAGPEMRQVDSERAVDISHLRTITASLALSSDARVVAQLNRTRLALAWVDRLVPRLDPWPESFELLLDGERSRLLAAAVDYGDEVICVVSTDSATYRVEVSPGSEPVVIELFSTPTRCAAVVAGATLTVDEDGRLRDWVLNLSSRGIAEVSSLDAARSAGRVVLALAGLDDVGEPVVAEGSSMETLAVRLGAPAEEVVVIRPLSTAHPPDQALLATSAHLERIPVGDVA